VKPNGSLWWFVLGVVVVVAWVVTMFFHLYRFSYPAMDSLCYFGPAVFAHGPGGLVMPFLGDFDGADRFWALNWPGGLLVESLFFPFLPKSPALYVGWNMVEWMVLALGTAAWVGTRTPRALPVFGAFFLVLFNRNFFDVAWFQRHEFFGCYAVLGAVYGVWRSAGAGPTRLGTVCLVASFFALPLMQPTCLLAGGVFLGGLILGALWDRKVPFPRYLFAAAGAYMAGLGAFFLYFRMHPGSWEVFREHAKCNADVTYVEQSYFFGKTLLNRLAIPSFLSENLLLAGAVGAGGFLGWRLLRREGEREGSWRGSALGLTLVLFLALVGSSQLTYNSYYIVLATPFTVVLFCWGVDALEGQGRGSLALTLLIGACTMSTVYYGARTRAMAKADWPDFPKELEAIRESLPSGAHRILIPPVLWEAALMHSGPFVMNTLPHYADDAKRRSFEETIYADLEPGDLLLLNPLEAIQPLYRVDPALWEKVGERKHLYSASKPHGYDITIWRRKPASPGE